MISSGSIRTYLKLCTLVILLGNILSACTALNTKQETRACPPVYILKQTSSLIKYRKGGPKNLTGEDIRGRIVKFDGECFYKNNNTELHLSITVEFEIIRGPANRTRQAKFFYFVAMPKFYPSYFGKKKFDVALTFEKTQRKKKIVEHVEIKAPVSGNTQSADFATYIGFQLSAEQVTLSTNLPDTEMHY